jgi:phosphoribosyl 1,2-cyclic phosphate phosphodiesterase
MQRSLVFLGTGTSYGVPMIGCDCAVCGSTDPRNRRHRASVLLRNGDRNILIDATPDFREQMLRHRIRRLDAILLTHPHADHIFGLDDVRAFSARQEEPIPVYGDADTLRVIRKNLDYAFGDATPSAYSFDVPRMVTRALDGRGIEVEGTRVQPVSILHGRRTILAYRIGDFAYVTDCSGVPDASMPLLEGLDTLVLGAVRHDPHPAHFSVEQALELIAQLSPRRAFLTHISHRLDHVETEAALPADVRLAYDGLAIEISARSQAERGEHGA